MSAASSMAFTLITQSLPDSKRRLRFCEKPLVDLRDYYAPHVDKAMVLCVGHKVKDFVQQLARLFESGKDSLLDVKAMERVAQEEMAAEDPKFQPLVYPFHRATDMQGESALAFLVSAA